MDEQNKSTSEEETEDYTGIPGYYFRGDPHTGEGEWYMTRGAIAEKYDMEARNLARFLGKYTKPQKIERMTGRHRGSYVQIRVWEMSKRLHLYAVRDVQINRRITEGYNERKRTASETKRRIEKN